MAILKNVVLVGATGNLGPHLLQQLNAAPDINARVLARPTSAILKNPPKDVSIITADFDSKDSLAEALKGVDAIVFSTGVGGFLAQKTFLDAAIAAGVKRFIPSEFGSDYNNVNAQKMAVFGEKMEARKAIVERADRGEITWTALSNGPFLEWCINNGFLGVNAKDKTAILYDGGKNYFSCSSFPDIGKAVVGILRHPEETKNKVVYMQSYRLTIQKLVEVVEKIIGAKLTKSEKSTVELEREAGEKIAQGDFSALYDQVRRVIFGEGFGSDFQGRTSNELLGVKELTDAELEEIVKEAIKGQY